MTGISAFIFILVALAVAGLALFLWWRRLPPTGPIEKLMRQAKRLKWVPVGTVPEDGYVRPWTKRSVRFERGDEEAVYFHADAEITLVRVHGPPTFDDFVELEEWLKTN